MSATTRVNGSFGNFQQGTVYTVAQFKAFIIDAQAALTTQDADAAGEVDQAMEALIREVQPLVHFSANTAQTVTVVVDGHAVDAASLQLRVRALGTVNGFNFAAATVTAAASLTAA